MNATKSIITSVAIVLVLAFGLITNLGSGGGGGTTPPPTPGMSAIDGLPSIVGGGITYNLSVTTTGGSGWTFLWSSSNAGDTFGTGTASSTTYIPAGVVMDTPITIAVIGTHSTGSVTATGLSTIQSTDCDLDPDNNTALHASTITVPFSCAGSCDFVTNADREDWYRFELASIYPPGDICVMLTNILPLTNNPNIFLYHESDLTIPVHTSGNPAGDDECIYYNIPAGQTGWYYLAVVCFADSGTYDLAVSFDNDATLLAINGLPSLVTPGNTYDLEVTATPELGWEYTWWSDMPADVFGTPDQAMTTYTPGGVTSDITATISVIGFTCIMGMPSHITASTTIESLECDVDPENDVPATAPIIIFPFTCTSAFCDSAGQDQTDFYAFELTSVNPPSQIIVDVTNIQPATNNPDLRLFHDEVAMNLVDGSNNGAGVDENITYTIPAGQTGWYFLGVTCVGGNGTYDIDISVAP